MKNHFPFNFILVWSTRIDTGSRRFVTVFSQYKSTVLKYFLMKIFRDNKNVLIVSTTFIALSTSYLNEYN